MLQTIRSHAGSWVIKFLLAAIVASFALWGIADIIRGYGANRPVAQIGKSSISVEEFSHAFKQAINNLQERFKAPLTPEMIKEMAIGEKVLQSLVDKELMAQDLKNLDIVISDNTVTNEIRSIPAFVKKDGTFDIDKFNAVLQAQGLHEKKFVQEMRSDLQQFQLFEGLTSGFELGDEYLEVLYTALEQPFHFVSLEIPFKKMAIKSPSESDLVAFFESHKESFRIQEVRNLTVLKLNRETLMAKVVIAPQDLMEEYDRRLNEFTTDEKRSIKQLTLTSPDQYPTVESMLKAGKPLTAIARDLKVGVKNFDDATKSSFGTNGEEVFALALGTPSKMIDTSKGWLVYVVEKITPAQTKPFDAVKGELEASLKAERFNDYFEDLQKQIEDALAGGSSFKEISDKFGLPIELVSGVTRSGKDMSGKILVDPGIAEELMEFAFANSQGSDSPFILSKDSKDNLMGVISRIESITLSNVPDFSVIKDRVTQVYTSDAQIKAAQEIALDAVQSVKSVTDLKKLASSKGFSVTALPILSRSTIDQKQSTQKDLSMDAIEQMFSLAKGESFPTQTKTGFKVIMVESVDKPKIDKEKFLKFKHAMHEMYKRDFKEGYKKYLEQTHVVTINKEQIDHVTGSTS